MASQRAKSRQTWENDFSPPERVLAPRPVLSLVMSGSTCCESLAKHENDGIESQRSNTDLQIK